MPRGDLAPVEPARKVPQRPLAALRLVDRASVVARRARARRGTSRCVLHGMRPFTVTSPAGEDVQAVSVDDVAVAPRAGVPCRIHGLAAPRADLAARLHQLVRLLDEGRRLGARDQDARPDGRIAALLVFQELVGDDQDAVARPRRSRRAIEATIHGDVDGLEQLEVAERGLARRRPAVVEQARTDTGRARATCSFSLFSVTSVPLLARLEIEDALARPARRRRR